MSPSILILSAALMQCPHGECRTPALHKAKAVVGGALAIVVKPEKRPAKLEKSPAKRQPDRAWVRPRPLRTVVANRPRIVGRAIKAIRNR